MLKIKNLKQSKFILNIYYRRGKERKNKHREAPSPPKKRKKRKNQILKFIPNLYTQK